MKKIAIALLLLAGAAGAQVTPPLRVNGVQFPQLSASPFPVGSYEGLWLKSDGLVRVHNNTVDTILPFQSVTADPTSSNGDAWYNSTSNLFRGQVNGGVDTFVFLALAQTLTNKTLSSGTLIGAGIGTACDNCYPIGSPTGRLTIIGTYQVTAGAATLSLNGSSLSLMISGSATALLSSTAFYPFADGGLTLGLASNRWSTVYGVAYNSGALQMTLTSGVADGAAPAFALNTTNSFTLAHPLFSVANGGTPAFQVTPTGVTITPSVGGVALAVTRGDNQASSIATFLALNGTIGVGISYNGIQSIGSNGINSLTLDGQGAGSVYIQQTGTGPIKIGASVIPFTNNAVAIGDSLHALTQVWAYQHAGVVQTLANAATVTVSASSGEDVRFTLGAIAETANFNAGLAGEVITCEIIQDATGSRSFTFGTGIKLAGGAYTPTATANKRDLLTFRYDATDSSWYEVGRAMNQ